MQKHRLFGAGLMSVIVFLAAVWYFYPETMAVPTGKAEVAIGSALVYADIADSPLEREQGLSGRTELSDGDGMLFIFGSPTTPNFWMKDMQFAIDIIWIGDDGRVLAVTENLTPESYPETVAPPAPVTRVLEVPAGFSERYGISVGQNAVIRF